MEGLNNGNQLYVTAYPAAWRIEIADEGLLRGFEYVRSELDVTRQIEVAH